MAKKTKDDIESEILNFLGKIDGIEASQLEEREQVPYWIDGGHYGLNWVISNSFTQKGSVPGTKAIIVAGESGMGKSFICDVFLGQQIRRGGIGIKLEVEDAGGMEFTTKIIGDKEIAKKIQIIGPKEDKKGNIKPITIEKLTTILNNLINFQLSKPEEERKECLLVIDSVSQLTSEKEFEDIQKDKDKRDMTPQQKLRALFRNLMQQFRLAKISIVGIAHMTANIGVMFGPKSVINAKGSGFGYASSLNLQITSNKEIEDPTTKIPVAIRMRIKTSKNRFEYKGRSCWLRFNFNKGIDKYSGLSEILAQYKIAKPSSQLDLTGGLTDSCTMKWEYEGETHSWKVKDTGSFIQSWPHGELALLGIWEDLLNKKLEEITGTGDMIESNDQDLDEDDLEYFESIDQEGVEEE